MKFLADWIKRHQVNRLLYHCFCDHLGFGVLLPCGLQRPNLAGAFGFHCHLWASIGGHHHLCRHQHPTPAGWKKTLLVSIPRCLDCFLAGVPCQQHIHQPCSFITHHDCFYVCCSDPGCVCDQHGVLTHRYCQKLPFLFGPAAPCVGLGTSGALVDTGPDPGRVPCRGSACQVVSLKSRDRRDRRWIDWHYPREIPLPTLLLQRHWRGMRLARFCSAKAPGSRQPPGCLPGAQRFLAIVAPFPLDGGRKTGHFPRILGANLPDASLGNRDHFMVL